MPSVFRACRASTVALGGLLAPALAVAEGAPFGADYADFTLEVQAEALLFPQEARIAGQEDQSVSLALRPSAEIEWTDVEALGGPTVAVTVTPFLRLDPIDDERTHADLREAKVDLRYDNTDITLGNDFVFWGKTESVHLVDIVNQTDAVEGTDGEDKLGQPMVAVRRLIDAGEFSGQASVFYFPYFRERTFAGAESRLRGDFVIDGDDARYETGAGEWTPGFAARLAGFYGDFDGGISAFHGLSRDPAFEPAPGAPGTLRPVYGEITQLGLDGQYTAGATLWKAEAIARFDQRDLTFAKNDYIAAVGGVEHTLYGIFDTNADLGLIAEYAWDGRGDKALTPFDNDAVAGFRLALNDTQDTSALATLAVDTETAETILRLEAERRIGDALKLELTAGAFLNTDDGSLLHAFRDDHYVRMTLSWFW